MGKKKSSFQMGNQFNGYGDTVYIKADPVTVPPVSQDNVTLTPDYSQYALYAAGGNPTALGAESTNETTRMMVGAISSLNQVTVTKSSSNSGYSASFSVSSDGFITNSYATNVPSNEAVTKSYSKFFAVVPKKLIVRRARTTKQDANFILAQIESGKEVKVVTEGKGNRRNYVFASAEDDSNDYRWIKVTCMPDKEYKQEGDGDGEVEGWVPRVLIREDGKRTLRFNELYNFSKVNMYCKYKNTQKNKDEDKLGEFMEVVNSFADWGLLGSGSYSGPVGKTDGKWNVAVAPLIIDWEYPPAGKVEADDIKGFSKIIKVFLTIKDDKKSADKSSEQTIECYVKDLKAHSFNQYPYPDDVLVKEGRDEGEYTSELVEEAWANVFQGFIQTGIKYPNVTGKKRLVVADENMDGSIIEFCGSTIEGLGFDMKDYELSYIETNYESSTKGV